MGTSPLIKCLPYFLEQIANVNVSNKLSQLTNAFASHLTLNGGGWLNYIMRPGNGHKATL